MIRAVAIAAALALAGPALAQDETLGTLTVGGTGQVSVAPDMATLRVGVETQAESAAAAVSANSEAAGRVIGTLKEQGVAAKDIQTADFSVSPLYESGQPRRQEGPRIVGYRAANQVVAQIHDLDRLGALLDAVVSSGANRIDGLAFGLEDETEAMDRARAKAVEDARRRAQVYADAAGVALGDIQSITESGGPVMPQPRMAVAALESSAAPIERGETTLSASVEIVWEILPGVR